MRNKTIVVICVIAAFLIGGWVGQLTAFVSPPGILQGPNHPITAYGSNDYEVLVENLGEQVRVTEELSALQERKIRKLQQQVEILDNAGLRSCDYLQRVVADLRSLQKALKAATLADVDIDKVRDMLDILEKNVGEAVHDVETIFLSAPVYRVSNPTEDELTGRYHLRKRVNRFFRKSRRAICNAAEVIQQTIITPYLPLLENNMPAETEIAGRYHYQSRTTRFFRRSTRRVTA